MSAEMTGILGGTFNPIHNQHLCLAKAAHEQLSLKKILLIPSGISYLKAGTDVLAADKRYKMCCLAAEGIPYIEVSDIEIKREGNSYTCDTLKELKDLNPDTDYCFIIGADTLFMLEKWKEPDHIFSDCIIAVASRLDGDRYTDDKIIEMISYYEKKYNADIRSIKVEVSGLSSSFIRQSVKEGEDISPYVPDRVALYIKENRLYR